MKSSTVWGLAGTAASIAVMGVALSLSGGSAHAQSGSRLCGYIMKGADNSFTGYLYEARQADVDYHGDCAKAAADIYTSYIDKGAVLPGSAGLGSPPADCHDLPSSHDDWHRHCENTCEDVGVNFQSSNSPKDMCDKMEAHQTYKVVFDPATNTTTYKKI